MKSTLLFSTFLILSACASGAKHLSSIDSSVSKIASGSGEQGRVELEQLCKAGSTAACALTGERKIELRKQLPIMQGVTSSTQSRFVVVVPRHEVLNYFVRAPGGTLVKLTSERVEHAGFASAVDQLEAFNLSTKMAYELIVIGPDGLLWDRRSFRALDTGRHRARLALVSGTDPLEKKGVWSQLLAQKPDVIFLLGDVVNPKRDSATNSSTPSQIWDQYLETWSKIDLFKADPLVPTLAVWDDQDFGKLNGDRTFDLRDTSAKLFLSFFHQRKATSEFTPGPGVSSWWNAFGAHFAFLDNRTFRSPNGLDLPDQTHFGAEGESWLKEQLATSREPTFLISGDPFFGSENSFEAFHPKRLKTQVSEWSKFKEPILFMSGNGKLSEILKVPAAQLGYPTYELTASGIGTSLMIVELIRSDRNFIQIDAQAFSPDRKQLYQKPLTVKH